MRLVTAAAALALLAGTIVLAPAAEATPAQATPAQAAASPVPVVFVHGRNADPGVWGTMKDRFEEAGYPEGSLFAWGYDSSRSTNEVLAGQLAAYVDSVRARTGSAQVDIVAHSQGSLPTRWYAKFGGGSDVVRHLVSLGGPNHGTSLAWACAIWDQGCRDMTPNSYVQSHLASGDETPGATRYATFWSDCDGFILPNSSVPLSGAVNTDAGCLAHNDLLTDAPTARGVLDFLKQ